jgi:hypothetical protein
MSEKVGNSHCLWPGSEKTEQESEEFWETLELLEMGLNRMRG